MSLLSPGTFALADLQALLGGDNDYTIYQLDLTTAHTDLVVNIAGLNLTVLSLGGGPFTIRFEREDGVVGPSIESTWLQRGDLFLLRFARLHFDNVATAGAAPAVFYIGRRVSI